MVTITGTSFTGATSIKFGTMNAANFTYISPTTITATSPAEAMGIVDVTVTTPTATSAVNVGDHFAFDLPPTVTTAATATPNPVTGTTANLSVLAPTTEANQTSPIPGPRRHAAGNGGFPVNSSNLAKKRWPRLPRPEHTTLP